MNLKFIRVDSCSSKLICTFWTDRGMQPTKIALIASIATIFALMIAPTAMAATYTGSIQCTSGCTVANVIPLTGPGSSGSANFEFYASNAPSGATMNYFVCPIGTGCSSNAGTDNGWSWTFTPASGTVSSCPSGSCEGAGYGSPSTMTLSLTAPSTVTPSNSQETLTIYACSQAGTDVKCDSAFTQVASLTVTATVPQFAAAGIGLAVVLGALGLILVRRKSLTPAIPVATAAV